MGQTLRVSYLNGSLDLVVRNLAQGELLEVADEIPVRGLTVERSSLSGEIVAFEALKFQEYYSQILADLSRYPLATRYDVPEWGLFEVPLEEVLKECYRRFVEQPVRESTEVAASSG